MIAGVVLLLALPVGYFCRGRAVGYLAFVAVFAHVYAFQTSVLVMEWVNGSDDAFARSTSGNLLDDGLGYFVFTTVVYAVGLVLVRAGQLLRARRLRGQDTAAGGASDCVRCESLASR